MFFDDDDHEKKLFEDIQFKRKVAFVDDDDIINIGIKPFSKTSQNYEVQDVKIQVNIQNELATSSSQTRSKKNREIQTESETQTDLDNVKVDGNRLKKLIDKRADLVESAIIENNETLAFRNYDVDWYGGSATTVNSFTLINQQLLKEEELQVTALEWNSTGTSICCAYGRNDHESVCTHRAALCTWNIDRLKIDVNKPDVTVETGCCISSIACHPDYPGIVAVGLFNGEINIYDVRQPEPLVATITDKKELHRDEVTVLKWIKDPKTSKKKYLLLSGSRDGKLLIWNALPAKNQLKLVEGFLMLASYLPRNQGKSLEIEMGVSALAMNNQDKNSYFIGCDSGGLFKCSLLATSPVSSRWEDDFPIELNNPVDLSYDVQHGPIFSISHSPFHRNLILTCGTDSEIKLYSLLQTSNLTSYCPESGYLYAVEWSPTRPCVFACASHQGNIHIYDLLGTKNSSAETIKASDGPIYSLSFNTQRPGYLASGDKSGVVKIWRLSQELTKQDPDELKRLNDISDKQFQKT